MTRWKREMLIPLPPGDFGPEPPARIPVIATSTSRQESRALSKAGMTWITSREYQIGGRSNRYRHLGVWVTVAMATGLTNLLRAHVTKKVAERHHNYARCYDCVRAAQREADAKWRRENWKLLRPGPVPSEVQEP